MSGNEEIAQKGLFWGAYGADLGVVADLGTGGFVWVQVPKPHKAFPQTLPRARLNFKA